MRGTERAAIVRVMTSTDTLFVFDLDGTLYDTSSSFLPTMNAVYREYAVEPPSDDTLLGLVGEPFPSFVDWLIAQGFSLDKSVLARRIAELEFAAIPKRGRLYPGVPETLAALRERGARLALCTNGDIHYAGLILDTFGLSPLFDRISTHSDGSGAKTERLRGLILSDGCSRCVMVGDRYNDMQAGQANGCTTVGAGYGFPRPGELDEADLVIEQFSDLLTFPEPVRVGLERDLESAAGIPCDDCRDSLDRDRLADRLLE